MSATARVTLANYAPISKGMKNGPPGRYINDYDFPILITSRIPVAPHPCRSILMPGEHIYYVGNDREIHTIERVELSPCPPREE